jgi:hypothetical protein
MRHRLRSLSPPVKAGMLLFVAAFALFSFTTQPLTGYEPETGAVTEGLVLQGHLWDDEGSSLPLKADIPGEGGHRYARTGLLQPLLEAPFFAAGHLVDVNFGWFSTFPFGYVFLWFFNPFVAALAAVALFALVFLTRGSLRWATVVASLFVLASIAWPYSKIGMETTFMFASVTAVALAVWARRSPSALSWGLTGFATGAAIATKPYAFLPMAAIAILLWTTFRSAQGGRRLRLGLAICLPLLAWGLAIAWYNWFRFGSPTDFGYTESSLTLSMPLNALGLLFSPGKGLILYSPLVVLGALGLPRLWRADRGLAGSLIFMFAALTCIAGASNYWGDEVWGPRYIVPVAWTLLVPIAWWADSALRRRAVAAVAAAAVFVQVIAISAQYAHYTDAVRALTGVPIYRDRLGVDPERIPYGDDPTRWIPQLSALLIQTEGLVSSQIVDPLGGHGLEVTYAPFEGRTRTVNLSDPKLKMPLDFWWYPPPHYKWLARLIAMLMAIVSAVAAYWLYLVSFGKRRPWGRGAPALAK